MCGDGSGEETPGLHQTTSCAPLIKRFDSGLTEHMCHIQHFALFPLSGRFRLCFISALCGWKQLPDIFPSFVKGNCIVELAVASFTSGAWRVQYTGYWLS